MRTFFNDISTRPAFSHVTFVEVDVDNDAISVRLYRMGLLRSLARTQPCELLTQPPCVRAGHREAGGDCSAPDSAILERRAVRGREALSLA